MDETLNEISHKLGVVINLIAYQITLELTVTEAAPLLDRLGLNPNEISDVLGSTPNTVRARISEAKKKQ